MIVNFLTGLIRGLAKQNITRPISTITPVSVAIMPPLVDVSAKTLGLSFSSGSYNNTKISEILNGVNKVTSLIDSPDAFFMKLVGKYILEFLSSIKVVKS